MRVTRRQELSRAVMPRLRKRRADSLELKGSVSKTLQSKLTQGKHGSRIAKKRKITVDERKIVAVKRTKMDKIYDFDQVDEDAVKVTLFQGENLEETQENVFQRGYTSIRKRKAAEQTNTEANTPRPMKSNSDFSHKLFEELQNKENINKSKPGRTQRNALKQESKVRKPVKTKEIQNKRSLRMRNQKSQDSFSAVSETKTATSAEAHNPGKSRQSHKIAVKRDVAKAKVQSRKKRDVGMQKNGESGKGSESPATSTPSPRVAPLRTRAIPSAAPALMPSPMLSPIHPQLELPVNFPTPAAKTYSGRGSLGTSRVPQNKTEKPHKTKTRPNSASKDRGSKYEDWARRMSEELENAESYELSIEEG